MFGVKTEATNDFLARFGTKERFYKIFLLLLVSIILPACSLEANISSLTDAIEALNREEPDFIYGEVVTTSGGTPGYEVKAVFGEVSEKTESLNGNNWKIEGAFYE